MHGRNAEQDNKIANAKEYVVNCIAEIKREITRKFLEQFNYNKALNLKCMTNIKKIQGIKADTEVVINGLRRDCASTVKSNQHMQSDL